MAPTATAKRGSRPKVNVEHQVTVGQTLVENVEGHAARTDSPQFKLARATLHKIVRSLSRTRSATVRFRRTTAVRSGCTAAAGTTIGIWC